MDTLIKLGGLYCILLIAFHMLFWKIFAWNEELPRLNWLNQAIMPVLNISLTFVFLIFAYLSLVYTEDLLSTALGRSLLGLISLFWVLRSALQIIYFRLKHWGSWAFLVFFLTGAVIYGIPLITVSS